MVFSLATYNQLAATGSFALIPLAGNNNEASCYKESALSQNKTLTDAQWELLNDEGFTCATAHAVSARAIAGIPSWRYTYLGDWDNLRLYPGSGSYHGS
jgi:cholinesterase